MVRISLFGGLTITDNDTAVSKFASRKAEALLVYLACNPRPHPRETLATLLWPENEQNRALGNLSVALTSLRQQVPTAVLAERHTVSFNTESDFELDTAVFQQALHHASAEQQRRGKLGRSGANQLETAVALYHGDFLAGFSIRNAFDFEAWVLLEQERLRQQFLAALTDLITFYQQRGQLDSAIGHAQRLLAVDPLQETIQRQLMRLYAADNQRTAALAQFEQCVRVLDEELGVEPDEETVALQAQIAAGAWAAEGQGGRGAEEKSPLLLRSSAPLHNLPAVTTTFVGRAAELARIEAWLAEPNGRLLTIVAPGGMGKTRLAQEAARAQLGQFADGVWVVSLVAYTEMGEVVAAVADAIGLTLSGRTDPATQLLHYLQQREMLLLLDNLEHLLTAKLLSFIMQLTEQAPDLCLIATSRERLRLQAETVLDLGGLGFPTSQQSAVISEQLDASLMTADWSLLTDYPAVQLFVNRAERIQASFRLVGQETAVVQLCQLVGGLPLALELAATWTRILGVAEIVAEIQRGLGNLTTTLRDIPQRHRSLRTVIESAWQLLAADEQALFRQLAVFRGGFTRTAAEAVVAARLPQLLTLVDRSFLRLDGDQRFRRHPLLLQFGQEQLAAQPDEQAQAQTAHAHFFAALVQEQMPKLPRGEAPQALATMGADWENIRAAWQWALATQQEPILQRLVGGIGRFFADRSRYLEGTAFFTESLAAVGTADSPALIAQMQAEQGTFLQQNGRLAEAKVALQAADHLARQHNLTATRLLALRYLGEVISDQGEREAARPYFEEALQLCREQGDEEQKLLLLWRRGILQMNDGAYGLAQTDFAAAMKLAEELGNRLHIARIHNSMGIIANRQQDFQQAIHHWQLARAGFAAWEHDWGLAATSNNLAMAYSGLKQYDAALENVQLSLAAHEKIGHKRGVAGSLAVMASIYLAQGKRRQARRHFHASLQLAQAVGATWLAIVSLVDLAELEMSYGELQRAALLLHFVVQHPAAVAVTQQNARALLDELEAELPEGVLEDVETAVRSYTLDSLIEELVNRFQ